jgi:carboxypeptidase Taq
MNQPTPSQPRPSSPDELFGAACGHARRTAVLGSVEAVLGWDEQTMLPPAAAAHRADQAAEMAAIVHRQRTLPEQADRLERLAGSSLATAGTPEQRATIRLLKSDVEKQARLPQRLVLRQRRPAHVAGRRREVAGDEFRAVELGQLL